jgi:hypothetical protein
MNDLTPNPDDKIRALLAKGESITAIATLTGAKKLHILSIMDEAAKDKTQADRNKNFTDHAAGSLAKALAIGADRVMHKIEDCPDEELSMTVGRTVKAFKELTSDGVQRIEVKHSGGVEIGFEAFKATLPGPRDLSRFKTGDDVNATPIIDVTPEKAENDAR